MIAILRICEKCGQPFVSGGPWPQATCDTCSPRVFWSQCKPTKPTPPATEGASEGGAK